MSGDGITTELNYDCSESTLTCSVPQSHSLLLIHGLDDSKARNTMSLCCVITFWSLTITSLDIGEVPVRSSMSLMRSLQVAGYEFKQQASLYGDTLLPVTLLMAIAIM